MKSLYQQMTLKTRITISFVLLMVAIMAFVVVAEQLDYDDLRAYVVSQSMQDEASRLEGRWREGFLRSSRRETSSMMRAICLKNCASLRRVTIGKT